MRRVGYKFKSPGVYVKERDTSGYSVKKNQLRRVNIIKIFSLDIHRDIYAIPYGGTNLFKLR